MAEPLIDINRIPEGPSRLDFTNSLLNRYEEQKKSDRDYEQRITEFKSKFIPKSVAIQAMLKAGYTQVEIDNMELPNVITKEQLDVILDVKKPKPVEDSTTPLGEGNFKKGEKVPSNKAEQDGEPAGYTKIIDRDGRFRISQDKLNGRIGYTYIGARDTSAEDSRKEARDEKTEKAFQEKVIAQFNKIRTDKRMTELAKQEDAMRGVEQLVAAAKDNTIATQAIGIRLPHALGEVGNLTETEQTRYVSSPQVFRNLQDKISKWTLGRPTEATMEEILELSNIISKLNDTKRKELTSEYVDNLANTYKKEPTEIALMLGLDFETEYIPKADRIALARAKQSPAAAAKAATSEEKRINVKRLSDGKTGSILEKDFDPAKYSKR